MDTDDIQEPPNSEQSNPICHSIPFLESLKLENHLIRVPYENLKKSLRLSGKAVEKDVGAVISGVSDGSEKEMGKEEVVKSLDNWILRLQGLKRKLDEYNKIEQTQSSKCRLRLEYLEGVSSSSNVKESQEKWQKTLVERILIDYMLRKSYYSSASKLAEAENIQDFVDIELFMEAKKVIGGLKNHSCSNALAWCNENKVKLKKNKSKLEFKLRLQEFIELVRKNEMMNAINYARKYLSPFCNNFMNEVQHVMATLAFKCNTDCTAYKPLFEEKQWEILVEDFKNEFYSLFCMSSKPLFDIYLQAGLSVLKTPFSYEEGCSKEDPVSLSEFQKLASPLPFSKHTHSKLVCWLTKEVMDDHNPPMVLPNGYVFSLKAIDEIAKKNNGDIVCPRTGEVFNQSQVVKAFVF